VNEGLERILWIKEVYVSSSVVDFLVQNPRTILSILNVIFFVGNGASPSWFQT